eukprot:TRINITY_DN32369_c0_g1_i1.p1 TRINITY_DN32369_c0_g1~~TRINITY_DN32369_c0_g1_i1.p1  ORF type:complete len:702 (+),score=85.86 TRINITY_DN32369_c0_g1_i1:288-2393(+)
MALEGAFMRLPGNHQSILLAEEGRVRQEEQASRKMSRRLVALAAGLLTGVFLVSLTLNGSHHCKGLSTGLSNAIRQFSVMVDPPHPTPAPKHPTKRPELELCVSRKVRVPRVEDLTLEEKIGQMVQVDKNALVNDSDITDYFLGSVLSGGGGRPFWGNQPTDWADMVDHYQAQAAKTRLAIPMVYGVDAVHGHNNVFGTTIFPHHVGLGATRNPELVQEVAAAVAREVAATGIRWAFSPAVSVCRDPRWGRCYESFSEDTLVVQKMTSEITGWQMKPTDTTDPAYKIPGDILVAACAKHFVGDGGTLGGQDQGNTVVDEHDLRKIHLPPYYDAIERNVQSIMVSYSSINNQKMHGNHYLVSEVLKGEMAYDGLIVSDWEAIQQLPGTWKDQVRSSINAGLDMIMVPAQYKEFIATLKEEVLAGRVAMSRINDAVRRILKFKENLGLFEDACAPRDLMKTIGSARHRDVGRRAVQESLVLLKNKVRSGPNAGLSVFPLPVKASTRVLVAGSHADDIGFQCGGWTIEWQGDSGNITTGTTILDGIKNKLHNVLGTTVTYKEMPEGDEEADYAIIVVGEAPYAEGMGDNQALNLDASAHAAISNVCNRMVCVVIVISGRPLSVANIIPKTDAFISAWLPGTEAGTGIAEVLFGDADFSGRSSFTWFENTMDLPVASASAENAKIPLFPHGHGLNKKGQVLPKIF